MLPGVGEALVAALGICASPFAVVPAILLLFTSRPAPSSAGFGGGWFAGIAGVTVLAVLLADLLTVPDVVPAWAPWTRIAIGVALVLAGLAKFRRRSPDPDPPAWMRRLEEATPRRAVRFGLLTSAANPKVALLAAAGGFSIGAEVQGRGNEILAAMLFTVIAASTAFIPVAMYLVRGERALAPLQRAKDWLTSRIDVVMSVVLVVLGVLLAWKGASSL